MTEAKSSRGILLSEQTIGTAELSLTYRLSVSDNPTHRTFYLTVISEDDSQTVALGNDLHCAVSLLETLQRGFVTPCSLTDVLDDLQFTKKR